MAEINLGRVKGDKGEKGDTGLQGLQGPTGAKGDKGEKGDTGLRGLTGLNGVQGLSGARGETGVAGPQGIQGIQGLPGRDGLNGATGSQGPIGPMGPTGSNGAEVSIMMLGEFEIELCESGDAGGFTPSDQVFMYIVNVLFTETSSVSFNFYNSRIDGITHSDMIQSQDKILLSNNIGATFNSNGEVTIHSDMGQNAHVFIFGLGY